MALEAAGVVRGVAGVARLRGTRQALNSAGVGRLGGRCGEGRGGCGKDLRHLWLLAEGKRGSVDMGDSVAKWQNGKVRQ